MGSIAKRPDGLYRARYRDDWGKERSRHFRRKQDARNWLEDVGSPFRAPRRERYPVIEPWADEPPETFRRPPPPGPPPPPVSLYRFFDAGGTLLYVGITSKNSKRWDGHIRDKQWWGRVRTAVIEHYPDRPSAIAAERAAIKSEGPEFNVQHRSSADQDRTDEDR
jgi:hypothetical protein